MAFIPLLDDLAVFDNSDYAPGGDIVPFASLAEGTLSCHDSSGQGLPYFRRVVKAAVQAGGTPFRAVGF